MVENIGGLEDATMWLNPKGVKNELVMPKWAKEKSTSWLQQPARQKCKRISVKQGKGFQTLESGFSYLNQIPLIYKSSLYTSRDSLLPLKRSRTLSKEEFQGFLRKIR